MVEPDVIGASNRARSSYDERVRTLKQSNTKKLRSLVLPMEDPLYALRDYLFVINRRLKDATPIDERERLPLARLGEEVSAELDRVLAQYADLYFEATNGLRD